MQEVEVAHFNIHEHYNDRTLENDICVVLLAAPLRSNYKTKNLINLFVTFFQDLLIF